MNRLDEILALLKKRESMFNRPKMEELIEWMGDRTDEEVVELLRTATTELAWRATGGHDVVYPSSEVFYEATAKIAEEFYEQVKVRNVQRSK